MAKRIVLKNATREIVVLNLPHGVVPEHATMRAVGTSEYNSKTGETIRRIARKPVSGSITLMPKGKKGDTSAPLDPAVLSVAEVRQALATKRITREKNAESETPTPGAPDPAPAITTTEPTAAAVAASSAPAPATSGGAAPKAKPTSSPKTSQET